MARVPRHFSVKDNFSVHKVWRGHNREPNLKSHYYKSSYLAFLNADLESEKFQAGAALQAFTLMSNHAHEVYLIENAIHFSNHMRRHHARYGAFFNRLNNRCGKVAQDRPHTTLIGDSDHQMRTVFYIHANPLRAGLVKNCRDYFFSTHRLYAFGKRELWMKNIQLPQWYLSLGKSAALRQRNYRRLFEKYLKDTANRKQHFLRKLFYGPLSWVLTNEQILKQWRNPAPPD